MSNQVFEILWVVGLMVLSVGLLARSEAQHLAGKTDPPYKPPAELLVLISCFFSMSVYEKDLWRLIAFVSGLFPDSGLGGLTTFLIVGAGMCGLFIALVGLGHWLGKMFYLRKQGNRT